MELRRKGDLFHRARWKDDGGGRQVSSEWIQLGGWNSRCPILHTSRHVRILEFQAAVCRFKRPPFPDQSDVETIHHTYHGHIELEAGFVVSVRGHFYRTEQFFSRESPALSV